MKSLLLTNEYPPNVYGGAGVHVDYLSRHLSSHMEVDVRCFGDQSLHSGNLNVQGFPGLSGEMPFPANLKSILDSSQRCLGFNQAGIDADVVHCHTWYTHLGGIFAKLNYGIPLVVTIHSLEPLRPWKREQLGGGYDFSLWVERTAIEMADAIIAVSKGTRDDVLRNFQVDPRKISVIYNGIDTEEYHKVSESDALPANGIDPNRPYVLFVGRITRQKGIIYLVNALKYLDPEIQVVLCAGAPDTPEIAAEMKEAFGRAAAERKHLVWIEKMLPRDQMIQVYSHAALFCCPSIYEPFGIINLEAMACETPVVASSVGGIPEVVVHGETGHLVPVAQEDEAPFAPRDPDTFSRDLARPINRIMSKPELRIAYGAAGRLRAESTFSWKSIAEETAKLYATLRKPS
ncbi:MAG: glycogen synthase [Puniceicoccales bacterium]